MSEVRGLSLEDIGNILGFWEENNRADEKERRTRDKLSKMNKGKK
jgi:hypothetical protein